MHEAETVVEPGGVPLIAGGTVTNASYNAAAGYYNAPFRTIGVYGNGSQGQRNGTVAWWPGWPYAITNLARQGLVIIKNGGIIENAETGAYLGKPGDSTEAGGAIRFEGNAGGLGGKFLVHHLGAQHEGQPASKVIRIHADGSLGNRFHAPTPWGCIYDMLPLPDGRTDIAGEFRLEAGNDTLQIVRVMPDGRLDTSFDSSLAMRQQLVIGADARVTCVHPVAPGLLALTGAFEEVGGQERRGICPIGTLGDLLNTHMGEAGCGSYGYQKGMPPVTYGVI
ncbi:MAG: delta-60 repeat domain-containing protein [Flavobacteriales bacterium]